MTDLSRRGLLGAIICAPAIVRASSLMPVKATRILTFEECVAIILAPMIYKFAGEIEQDIFYGHTHLNCKGLNFVALS